MRLIGIGELREWLRVPGAAARARVPADLIGAADGPDDRQLGGDLLRAAALGAAAHWTRGLMLPAIEAGYRQQGHDALADLTGEPRSGSWARPERTGGDGRLSRA